MIRDYFRFSIKSILHRKLRSWLTIFGIVIGVAAIVALITVSEGMENAIKDQFNKMGINNLRVVPAGLRGPPVGDQGFTQADADFIEKIKSVEYVDPLLINFANIGFDNEEQFLMTNAYDTSLETKGFLDADLKLSDGRYLRVGEKDSVLLGYKIAKDGFDKEIRVRNSITINEKKFRVIGIFEKTGIDVDNRIYLPLETARDLFDKPDIVNAMTVKIRPGFDT